MNFLEREEMVGLAVLLTTIIGLSLVNKLEPTTVDALRWLAMAYFGALGAKNILPDKEQ